MKAELKIIADHLRSSSFLVADGILPSNEGRGYVLRRIMRRAMRQLHKLGAKEASMYKLVDSLIQEMGQAYPELIKARDLIIETLKIEEEKFRETLEKGLKILEEEIAKTKDIFSGQIAFKLYDTYGFPLDLTEDILKEKNIKVDKKTFDEEMEKQKQRARKNWAGSGEEKTDEIFFALKEKFGESEFCGYENNSLEAEILAIEDFGDQKFIILNKTPFYATSGGQKGDSGIIKGENGEAQIFETKKFAGNLFVHFASQVSGALKAGDKVSAQINQEKRNSTTKNHSATHLMHKALKEVLGNSVVQKGSNVNCDGFTFDFNLNRAMSEEEISEVENKVNCYIQNNVSSQVKLMDLEEAKNSGAEALFGEKYDEQVRVVTMSPSIELCGGTHVNATGDIGIFKIISEKGIASGIRRIEAITGQDVINYYRDLEVKIKENEENFLNSLKAKDKEIERLNQKILFSNLSSLKAEEIAGFNLIANHFEGADANGVRQIANKLKSDPKLSSNYIFALFGSKDGKVSFCLAASNDLLDKFNAGDEIKKIVPLIGGKGGGGKKDMAFAGGSQSQNIEKAINFIKSEILI